MTVCRPTNVVELRDAIADAGRAGARLEIYGGGSKAAVGAPREAAILDMSGFSGVLDYDPAELALTVGAGTPLREIEALIAGERGVAALERRVRRAFDPAGVFETGRFLGETDAD